MRVQKGIQKLKRLLEQEPGETNFTPDLYMHLYTCAALSLDLLFAALAAACAEGRTLRRTIYNMCTQKPPHDYSEELYARYRESFERYIQEKARPALSSIGRALEQQGPLEVVGPGVC